MNVIISIDKNYLDKAETMLFSLRNSCGKSVDICVYLLYNSLSEKDVAKLVSYCKRKCNICVKPIKVDKSRFADMRVGAYFSIETYFRLLAQFLLPENVDRALYLDADMIVLKDVSGFYGQPFGDNYLVVCPDSMGGWGILGYQKSVLNLPESHMYFNAGVLLMNIKLLREETTADNIMSVANSFNGKLLYYDQDLLNILYAGKVICADEKYNHQKRNRVIKRGDEELKKDIAIMHYVGYYKPWKWRGMDRMSKYYWQTRLKQGHVVETCLAYICSPFARLARKIKAAYLEAKNKKSQKTR